MNRRRATNLACAVFGAAALFSATQALAVSITYTETLVGSGSLAGNAFTDATITITGIADTTGQFFVPSPSNQWGNGLSSLIIDISGVGIATFNGGVPTVAFANPGAFLGGNPTTEVGFGIDAGSVELVILATFSDSLNGYQLVTAIGPVTAFGATQSPTVPTTLGDFILNSVEDNQSTFTATFPAAVPGPIVGTGLPGLLAGFGATLAWYRKRRAAVWPYGGVMQSRFCATLVAACSAGFLLLQISSASANPIVQTLSSSISFGNVAEGTTSLPRTLSFTGTPDQTAITTNWQISILQSTFSADFSISQVVGCTLQQSTAESLCDVGVTFQPSSVGPPIEIATFTAVFSELVSGGSSLEFSAFVSLSGHGIAADASVGAPGPIVGAGLPGLLAGVGAMLAWYRKRRAAV